MGRGRRAVFGTLATLLVLVTPSAWPSAAQAPSGLEEGDVVIIPVTPSGGVMAEPAAVSAANSDAVPVETPEPAPEPEPEAAALHPTIDDILEDDPGALVIEPGAPRTKRRTRRRRRPRVVRTRRGETSLEVVRTVATGVQPKSVYVSPDGSQVWVSNFGFRDHDNVFVYDGRTLAHIGTVTFPGNAVEVAFSPHGSRAYVSNLRGNSVEVVNTETFAVERHVEVRGGPKFMVTSPDGGVLYVASYFSGRVTAIDTDTLETIAVRRTGRQPRGMVVRDNGELMVASFRSDFIQVFAPNLVTERRRFNTCEYPRHLQQSPDGRLVYVVCTLGNVSAYDISRGRRVFIAPTGRNPRSMAISSDGRWLATANFHSSDVSLVDVTALSHRTSRVRGAEQLVGLALHPGPRLRVYATSWRTGELYVLEPR